MPEHTDPRWYIDRMPSRDVLEHVLSGDPVAMLLSIATERAIVDGGHDLIARDDTGAARAEAMLELAAEAAKITANDPDATLTPRQMEALKLFILLVSRPAILVQDGTVSERPDNWPEIDEGEALLRRRIAGAGRLDSSSGHKTGSGFLVGDQRVMTNNHVVCALLGIPPMYWFQEPADYATRCEKASAEWADGVGSPIFEALGEFGSAASRSVAVVGIRGHHEHVDMAVLELAGTPEGARRVRIATTEPADMVGRRIYAVGYPVLKGSAPLPVFERVFGAEPSTLGRKRFSPGTLRDPHSEFHHHHDASTLRGSSGSCIVDFEADEVIGLHYAGAYESNNSFVPLWKFTDDSVLVDSGVTFGA